MPLVLITPPAEEPLTIAEAQEHLRLEADANDSYVPRLITAARQHVEEYTGRALVTQTWDLLLERFPCRGEPIRLDKGRLQNAAATQTTPSTEPVVTYLDAAGAQQTLSPSLYQVDAASEPGRILLAPDASWPDTQAGRYNAVRVRFVAGYGGPDSVPEAIKAAMLLIVGHLYEHRETEVIGAVVTPFVFAVDALLGPYRTNWGFG